MCVCVCVYYIVSVYVFDCMYECMSAHMHVCTYASMHGGCSKLWFPKILMLDKVTQEREIGLSPPFRDPFAPCCTPAPSRHGIMIMFSSAYFVQIVVFRPFGNLLPPFRRLSLLQQKHFNICRCHSDTKSLTSLLERLPHACMNACTYACMIMYACMNVRRNGCMYERMHAGMQHVIACLYVCMPVLQKPSGTVLAKLGLLIRLLVPGSGCSSGFSFM